MKIFLFHQNLFFFFFLLFLSSLSNICISTTTSPSQIPSFLPSIQSRKPSNVPSFRPSFLSTSTPTKRPTSQPTKRPTNFPTSFDCMTITIAMIDQNYNGWSGNYLTILGSKSTSNSSMIKVEIISGYYSQYVYFCLPSDIYTVQCCHGDGGYEEISWTISASLYNVYLSGSASNVCEDTTQTFTLSNSNDNNNNNNNNNNNDKASTSFISSPLFVILLTVFPISLTVFICCCVRWTIRRKIRNFQLNKNISQLNQQMTTISQTNQGMGHTTSPPIVIITSTFIPQQTTPPHHHPSSSFPISPSAPPPSSPSPPLFSNKPINIFQTPTSPFNPSSNQQFTTNPINNSSSPSAPPIPSTNSDILSNTFPEFYSNKESTYGYR